MQPLADAWAMQWTVPEGGVHPQAMPWALSVPQCPDQLVLVDWVAMTKPSTGYI